MVYMNEQPERERPRDTFVRWLNGTIFQSVEKVARMAEAEGEPVSEAEETAILRTMRRAAALTGAVGALVAGRFGGEDGLRIFAEMCGDAIALDPDLMEVLPAMIENGDASTRAVLADLLALAERARNGEG